jgi:hypothetical protein
MKFQEILKQREIVLRDSYNELHPLVSQIERECLEITNAYAEVPSRASGNFDNGNHPISSKYIGPGRPTAFLGHGSLSMKSLKLYAANCKETHIIAEGPIISAMLENAADQGSSMVGRLFATSLFPPCYINPISKAGINGLLQRTSNLQR